MKKIRCNICNKKIWISKERVYETVKIKSKMVLLHKEEKRIVWSAVDCQNCGCQTLLKKRHPRPEDLCLKLNITERKI